MTNTHLSHNHAQPATVPSRPRPVPFGRRGQAGTGRVRGLPGRSIWLRGVIILEERET
jgi:hypothetical protein